jgi:hypothetical protein
VQFAAAEAKRNLRIAAVEKEEANKAAQDAAEAAGKAAEAVQIAAEEDAKLAEAAEVAEAVEVAKAAEAEYNLRMALEKEEANKAAQDAAEAAAKAEKICREAKLKRLDEERKETRRRLAITRKQNDEIMAKKGQKKLRKEQGRRDFRWQMPSIMQGKQVNTMTHYRGFRYGKTIG